MALVSGEERSDEWDSCGLYNRRCPGGESWTAGCCYRVCGLCGFQCCYRFLYAHGLKRIEELGFVWRDWGSREAFGMHSAALG